MEGGLAYGRIYGLPWGVARTDSARSSTPPQPCSAERRRKTGGGGGGGENGNKSKVGPRCGGSGSIPGAEVSWARVGARRLEGGANTSVLRSTADSRSG